MSEETTREVNLTPVEAPLTPVETPVTPVEAPITPIEAPITPVETPVTPVEAPIVPDETPVIPVTPKIVKQVSVAEPEVQSEVPPVADTLEENVDETEYQVPQKGPRPVSGNMEAVLQYRERVGVQDFVLLEDYTNETAFIENLKKRFNEDIIYTYIGSVLISVNPYKELPIYGEEKTKSYFKKSFFEVPPHVFAITDNAYRSLTLENREQCILISGESGSGKTEASKKVLEYIAARTGHLESVEDVKNKLLLSNPLLEAFGNAKTVRNDNSSRFGKYMDVQFNFEGGPEGGHILNYLLEKSRVVNQMPGERNFHIFYQLLAGGDDELLDKLRLRRNLDTYKFTTEMYGLKDVASSDASQYRKILEAMKVIGISPEEQMDILSIIAAVLHVGNIKFVVSERGNADVLNHDAAVRSIAEILNVNHEDLCQALISRTIDARGDRVNTPLDEEQANFARDAIAKAVYERLFSWLVNRVNTSLKPKDHLYKDSVIGILDIYGFEIFQKNSFEQFCINYCNEKLQQLFIQLTLKSEQEEYLREGIEWEPIQYFNNQIICDLIEERHRGIISILDDECLRPGEPTDLTFLEKLASQLHDHPHFVPHMKGSKVRKTMGRDEFSIVHYAGEVTYSVRTFLEKNNDLLFRDIQAVMSKSGNSIIAKVFPSVDDNNKKRPETAISQFKNSLNDLVKILSSKEPSYIRCIKPNDFKQPNSFDDKLISHQVKYLGLMENLRVRRAGFAYRRTYEAFLQRYKCLATETWPNYKGESRDAVQFIINTLDYDHDEYRMGNTKIFIRFPKTLFKTEDAFQVKKHDIATFLQSRWRGYIQRKKYQQMREAAIIIQKWVRRYLAQKEAEKRRWAVRVIRDFIKGFITRNGPETPENRRFLSIAKVHWLKRLAKSLPTSVLDMSWPVPPTTCKEASDMLQKLHRLHLSRKYRNALSEGDKKQFEMKVVAESMFKGKKASYADSLASKFVDERLSPESQAVKQSLVYSPNWDSNEKVVYSCDVIKYDRRGYKPRERVLLVSSAHLYLLEGKKIKHKLPLEKLKVVITHENDSLAIVRVPEELKNDKGDLILSVPNLIEALSVVTYTTKKPELITIADTKTIVHNLVGGKQGTIEVTIGPQANITKAKSGNLLVIATR